MWSVYVLRCPDSGEVRYVGVSKAPEKRLARHMTEARAGRTKRHNWVRSLDKANKHPVLEVIETDVEDWKSAERRWVSHYRSAGCNLVNGNDGGECMKQARAKVGRWPCYERAMRRMGQDIRYFRDRQNDRLVEKVTFAQGRLRAAAKRLKAEGRMQELEDRLSQSVFASASPN